MDSSFSMECGCHCIRCGDTNLNSKQVSEVEEDGYYGMHHTCRKCNAHFDHLEGVIFEKCEICGYEST